MQQNINSIHDPQLLNDYLFIDDQINQGRNQRGARPPPW